VAYEALIPQQANDEDFDLVLIIENKTTGALVDITGWEFDFILHDPDDQQIVSHTSAAGDITVVVADSSVTLHIGWETLSVLPAGEYPFSVRFTTATGSTKRLIDGKLPIAEGMH